MLEIYVCEDNERWRKLLSEHVSDYCAVKNVDAALTFATHDPKSLLSEWSGLNPALFLLDIDLKSEINGIELARLIREKNATGSKVFIIFITTHSEMTLLTFQYKVEALDFLIKDNPDSIKIKIGECIDIALRRSFSEDSSKVLKVTVDDRIIFVELSDIIFIETTHVRHKLRLHTNSRVLEFGGELKEIEAKLDDCFSRCHKSYIINKNKIASINKKEKTVTMTNNTTCLLSRNWKLT
ncbi:MAG: LytTR family DNA-binding domain-containing protein [Oscillospiraceae bacterium]|nr:LytTR family DNA-binding domain-containing protein [Oscillospiraceae bacterium]